MKYSPAALLQLLRTPLGRHQIAYGLRFRAWPIYAAAARVHRGRLDGRARFVAIVGSFGKTTTTRAVLAALGRDPHSQVGGNSWSFVAQRVLAARAGEHTVIEVGISGPGQMARYASLVRPDITVVTSIGSEHNRSLGTLERTRDEKAAMVRALPPDGVALLNGDDPNVLWMRTQTRARVLTYGFGADNDIRGGNVRLDWPHGMRLDVTVAGATREVRSVLIGRTMAYPLLAGVAVGHTEGRDPDEVARALAVVEPPPGRLERIALANGVWLLRDEYKSALETVHAALDVVEQIPARRKIVVLGEIAEPFGSQGPIYRDLGARLAGIATCVIVVGSHHQPIAAGAARAGLARTAVLDAGRSVARTSELLGAMLEPGDVVLLKGRDTQKLDRIYLALTGQQVGCDLVTCDAKLRCARCPMLARGWQGRPVVM